MKADLRRRIELAGHPEARVAHAGKNLRPFARFERDAVRALKAGGDEADALGRAGGEDAGAHDKEWRCDDFHRLRKAAQSPSAAGPNCQVCQP